MNVATLAPAVDFEVPPELEASVPPEERGLGRNGVRMMVSSRASGTIEHRMFADLPHVLKRGDLLVVNRSSTVNAALEGVVDEKPALLHCRGRWTSGGGSSSYGIRMQPVWAASPGSTPLPGRRSSCRSTARPSFARQCCRAAGMKRCGCGSPRCMCLVGSLNTSRLGEGRSPMATLVRGGR